MNILAKIIGFFGSSKQRIIGNPHTTVAGGVLGVVGAAVIGKIEEMSGCHFSTAFANIDWVQLAFFVFAQVNGALSTDANKTISTESK